MSVSPPADSPKPAPDRFVGDAAFHLVAELQLLGDGLPVGSSLPSEANLAEKFGVSRLTVREALKVLAGRGLAELKQGRRAVVTEPSSEITSSIFSSYLRRDPSAMLELVEVRQALEVQSVRSAARKATRAGLVAMQASLQMMHEAADLLGQPDLDKEARLRARALFKQSDVSFHESVALSSGNRMLAHVLEALEDSLFRTFAASFEGHMARGGSAFDTYEAHLKIFQSIEAHDVKGSTKAMRDHLQEAERDLRAFFLSREPTD